MLIIPELETVVLQPPRTGTTSVKAAVLDKYSESFLLYRHMEADGLPDGYRYWRVIAQVRDPVQRLQSLYKYMRNPKVKPRTDPAWVERVKAATAGGFDAWLDHHMPFTDTGTPGGPYFRPRYAVRYRYPEQRKSQRLWAPEGCELIRHETMDHDVKRLLDVDIEHLLPSDPAPGLRCGIDKLDTHLSTYMPWDAQLYGYPLQC